MQKITEIFSHPILKKFDNELLKIFDNAPHLPKKVIEVLTKVAPYLLLISGVFLISNGLRSLFGFNRFYQVFALFGHVSTVYFYILGVLQIIAGLISLMAYQPLKNKQAAGWYMLLALSMLELLMNLLSVIFLGSGIFGLLLGLLISLYLLYELRSVYVTVVSATKKIKNSKK